MRVLVACEMSGIVRDAFAAKGHDAWSCDLMLCDKPGNHYWGDVMDILPDPWDLIIGHPPCTYLCRLAGHYVNPSALSFRPNRIKKLQSAAAFFKMFLDHPCKRICVENPTMSRFAFELIQVKATQFVEPWMFGEPYSKKTGLWLKGLPPLVATHKRPRLLESWVKLSGDSGPRSLRAVRRAITFKGIAEAMADQWG